MKSYSISYAGYPGYPGYTGYVLYLLCILLLALPAFGQNSGYNGDCHLGNKFPLTQGLASTTAVLASYPKCTVSVYNTGTNILSTIYSTAGGAALANPFQANTDGSYLFFADPTACYDITISPSTSGGTPVMPGSFSQTGVCMGYTLKAYDHTGVQVTGVHVVRDTCTLGTNCTVTLAGSAVFSDTSYVCTASDATAANPVRIVNTAANTITITGTGTDVINYSCVGK